MAHDVFISYAIEDQRVADAVCEALEEGGIQCWYAPRDVPYAVEYEEAIIDGISQSKLMLLILSTHANNSAHVKRELQNACREEPQIPVLPFQIEDVSLSKSFRYYIGSVHWLVAATPPLEAHLQKLVNYVQQRLPQPEQGRDSGEQGNQSVQAETVEKDEQAALRLAEESLRLAEEVEQRRVDEEERLAAEAQRKEEEERQRREAEEKRRAEEEETKWRLAEEEAARLVAEEQRREVEEGERREAEERQRLEAEKAAKQQAEDASVRAEAKARMRPEQEAEHKRVEAEHLNLEKTGQPEDRGTFRHKAEEAERPRVLEQELQPSIEEKPPVPHDSSDLTTIPVSTSQPSSSHTIADVAVEAPPRSGKSKRTKLLVIACIVFLAIIAFAMRQVLRGRRQATAQNGTPASSQQPAPGGVETQGDDLLHASTEAPHETAATPQPVEGMIYVPGGKFTMGRDDGDEYERPAHEVSVNAFFIDMYEVTNEEYEKFVRERGWPPPPTWKNRTYPPGTGRRPVGVTWDDARAYADWAGKRLPTEEEWEFAARGTDGRHYPWGNDWRAGAANAGGASRGLADVGTYKGTSFFGALDMVGNAWEWTMSDMGAYADGKLLETPRKGTKVLRGGSYKSDKDQATATYRYGWRAHGESTYTEAGFRCVKDAVTGS